MVALERAIAEAGTSLSELMDRAGLALAHRIHESRPNARIVILCGNGNNGGDGWVAARELAAWNHDVTLVTAREPDELRAQPARDAAIAAQAALNDAEARALHAPSDAELKDALEHADVIVAAILGTGFSGETVKEPFASWIELANQRHANGARIVAADTPSGLNAQTGQASRPCIEADETVTMIVPKPGLARPQSGKAHVAPLAYIEPIVDEE